jgi:hypothetical protein
MANLLKDNCLFEINGLTLTLQVKSRIPYQGILKGESITVMLTSCLTGLQSAV